MECGCGVFIADEGSRLGDTVVHCPMHAAAGDMILMLAKTLGALEGIRAGAPNWEMPSVDAVITEAIDFLARVKGDA